ncbi:MAG TPA: DUF6518 family protein [Gaiellaceae bacterium]|nr:DUF6518 family protein [Gaiellaceae bacterium]
MGVVLALVLSAAFGAGDQYLGSLTGSGHVWAAGWSSDISLLSAPWVVLAFVAGATQRDPRRAALIGLACTYAALLGYGVMTLSPVEHAHLTAASLRGFVVSERLVLVGGIATGPLFGWFGQQWRTRRAITGALATAACLCLEPLARRVTIDPITHRDVWVTEVAIGLVLAAAALLLRFSNRFSHTSQA